MLGRPGGPGSKPPKFGNFEDQWPTLRSRSSFNEGCSSRWRIAERSAKSATMQGSSTRAGGCFLTIFILLGFLFGLSIQNPLKGTLIGTGVGAALAILTWIVDLRRRGN
jgi:hypothetical protein